MKIVYDASVKPNKDSASLTVCLDTVPPLQNSLQGSFVGSRFRSLLLHGDIKKAFQYIRIQGSERHVLRFHCVKNCDSSFIEINKFTRLVFGLTHLPFILGGRKQQLKQHFQHYINEYPKLTEDISEDMYVDDIVSDSSNIEEVEVIIQKSIELFRKGGFNLHK